MKKVKLLSLALALWMLLSVLSACTPATPQLPNDPDTPAPPTDGEPSDPGDTTPPDDPGNNDDPGNDPGNEPGNEPDENKIDINQIAYTYGYSEGLMFVTLKDPESLDYGTLYCIDKKGTIVFTLEETAEIQYRAYCNFNKEYAVVEEYNKTNGWKVTYVLCDKQGNLTRPEAVGADTFLFDNDLYKEMFADGYILARKTTTSFTGSTDELAILNGNLEVIVDFSKDCYTAFAPKYSYEEIKFRYYYDGYLFSDIRDDYFDLRTGTLHEDKTDLREKMTLKNKSDFWDWYAPAYGEGYGIYDIRDIYLSTEYNPPCTVLIDLSQYRETIDKIYPYADGTAGIVFEVEDAQVGYRYYFTIMDESGTFLFEPAEVSGRPSSVSSENGIWVLDMAVGNRQTAKIGRIEVYDATGKIAELEYPITNVNGYFYSDTEISEGIIVHRVHGVNVEEKTEILNTKLEPLFE